MDIKTKVIYDSGTDDFCFSLKKQDCIEIGEESIFIGEPKRLAVCPGDFDKVEKFAPELLPVMEQFWTLEVIENWNEKQKELEKLVMQGGQND